MFGCTCHAGMRARDWLALHRPLGDTQPCRSIGLPSPWARDRVACSRHDAGWSTPAMTSTATDLVECAEFGVSELVTNAVLHGTPPIKVRVRGTWEHPRVEVIDGSTEPPILPGTRDPEGRRRPAADLRPRPRHRGPLLHRVGRRDRGRRQGRLVRPGQRAQRGRRGRRRRSPGVADCRNGERAAARRAHPRRGPRRPAVGVPSRSRCTTASCAARCGCWPSRTSPTTRWPRPCPTCSARSTATSARASGARTSSRPRPPARPRPTCGSTCRARPPSRSVGSSSSWTWRMRSVATSASCHWRRTPEQRRFQQWFLGEFVRQLNGEAPLAWPDAPEPGRTSVG